MSEMTPDQAVQPAEAENIVQPAAPEPEAAAAVPEAAAEPAAAAPEPEPAAVAEDGGEQGSGDEAAAEPDAVPVELATALHQGGATSNETPTLPPNLHNGAAKAHAILGRLLEELHAGETDAHRVAAFVRAAHTELDKYVPAPVRHAALVEAEVLIRGL